jgi:hypothetical protein
VSLTGTERDHLISYGASTPRFQPGRENGDNTLDKGKACHGHLWIIKDNEA